jgi:hypothetical protein
MEVNDHNPNDWQGRRLDQVNHSHSLAFGAVILGTIVLLAILLAKLF